jgi:hypothetical protein
LVVTRSSPEEVTEFVVLSAELICRVILLEPVHTSDPPFDPAMVLFESIVQVEARPVADGCGQASSGLRAGRSYARRLSPGPAQCRCRLAKPETTTGSIIFYTTINNQPMTLFTETSEYLGVSAKSRNIRADVLDLGQSPAVLTSQRARSIRASVAREIAALGPRDR